MTNRRILHARRTFDPDSGERHLKGAYLEYCEFKDKLRVLLAAESNGSLQGLD